MKTLSIVIPVFNESRTILEIIMAVQKVELKDFEKEIILVDDYSTDGTREVLKNIKDKNVKVFLNDKNHGKGYSLRRGFKESTGDFIIVQDADLEYDPSEYANLLVPMLEEGFDVVYGSRFKKIEDKKIFFKVYFLANKFLTILSNIFTGLALTDMETCYKCFTKESLKKVEPFLKSDRFEIEPEITAQVAKLGLKIKEIPISYFRRSYAEGKKIGWRDGVKAVITIIKQ